MRIAVLILIAVGLTGAVTGCSRSAGVTPVAVVRAGGTLTRRGQPVGEAVLTFQGDDESEAAFAQTDANGNFQCMTNDSGAGLPPGEYVVTVSSPRGGVPARYAAAETSPLSITVEDAGANQFSLELED